MEKIFNYFAISNKFFVACAKTEQFNDIENKKEINKNGIECVKQHVYAIISKYHQL